MSLRPQARAGQTEQVHAASWTLETRGVVVSSYRLALGLGASESSFKTQDGGRGEGLRRAWAGLGLE